MKEGEKLTDSENLTMVTFKNWKEPTDHYKCDSYLVISIRSSEMDKESKEKTKKKKTKKGKEDGAEREGEVSQLHQYPIKGFDEGTETSIQEDSEAVHEPGPRNKTADTLKERGRTTPEGFYIAHPRNIKRTAHFKDVHSRKLSELLEAFHMFDFDRDGVINQVDLKKTFASLCVEVTDEEIDQMLSEALNPLNFDAFVILLGYKTLDLDPEEVLLDALSNWDDHQEGLISYDRFMQNITAWGDKFTEEEATAALADAPIVLNKTKEKMIDYIQFSEDLCGLRKMMQRKTNKEGN